MILVQLQENNNLLICRGNTTLGDQGDQDDDFAFGEEIFFQRVQCIPRNMVEILKNHLIYVLFTGTYPHIFGPNNLAK